ncbi:MAG: alpha/beta hydrolase [Cryomorphaceae bacterium]
MAKALAVRLFLTPIKFPLKSADKEAAKRFQQRKIKVGENDVMVYSKGEGPEVLCLHGWSGQSMQFKAMAERIVSAGYTCVLIDAPGHGQSTGGTTNMFEFAEAFGAVWDELDHPVAAIGHSLGAASISYAVAEGMSIPAFASFGAPVVAADIISEFLRRINGSSITSDGIEQRTLSQFGRSFESVTMQHTFKEVQCPVLGIHGVADIDVPVSHLKVLQTIRPDMEAHVFEGMGHRRILKDERTLDVLVTWLQRLPSARKGQ